MNEDLENIMPLSMILEYLPAEVTLPRLRRWADVDRSNNFPAPVERIGDVRFYEKDKVVRWVTLFLKTQRAKNVARTSQTAR